MTDDRAPGEHRQPKSVVQTFRCRLSSCLDTFNASIVNVPITLHIYYCFTMAKIECSRSALFALVCLAILERTSAQMIGVDICACLPTVVTFRLNFTFECDASNVAGPGIIEPTCLIETRQNDIVTDFIPTSVSLVQIFELNDELAVVGDSVFDAGYSDGSEITYTSIVERAPDNITSVATLPRGFQVWITGVNAAEQTIINQIAITYTGGKSTDCGRFSETNYHLTFLLANLRVWNISIVRSRRADWMDSVRKYLILILSHVDSNNIERTFDTNSSCFMLRSTDRYW